MRAALVILLVAGIARAEEPTDTPFAHGQVVSCQLKDGQGVTGGCWFSAEACITKAQERRDLIEKVARLEAERSEVAAAPPSPSGGPGWKAVAIALAIGAAAGFGIAKLK